MTPVRSSQSLLMLALICFLVIGATAVVVPSRARADYTISWCQNGVDPPLIASVDGAQPFNQIVDECDGAPPQVALEGFAMNNGIGEPGGDLYENTLYEAGLSTPEGTGITISQAAMTLVSQPYGRGPQAIIQASDDQGLFFSHQLSAQDTNWTYNIDQAMPANDRAIAIGEECPADPEGQTEGCEFHTPKHILAISKISLTLHDDEQPTAFLTGGNLLLAGTHAGTEDVTFSASAPDSGIAEVDAYLGSTIVGSDAYQSTQCSYTRFDPCPQSVNDSIAVDTTKVPDGSYPLVLEAYDASGNVVGVPWSVPITLANDAPPASASTGAGSPGISSGPGAPNGHDATTRAEIAYLSGQHGKIAVRDGRATSLTGRLTNQTGTPIPDATVEMLYQTVGSIEPFVVGGHATSNSNGVYTFDVPPGPSRVIRTGYRAFANESGYDATADLTEIVTAATSLGVTPNHLRGRTFMFSGQVHASNFPPGQQVEIQALVGSAWTHVTYAQVTPSGHFKVRYRLKHHYNHVTFIFRATPVTSPIWPYEPRESNRAQLHLL
jgi:hypothetical protein